MRLIGAGNSGRFIFLDGMRGVAALAVGWLHASQIMALKYKPAHASLAVDFFFCLSGFVIAYAYDAKIYHGMSFNNFSIKRLVRLYPMILCGVLLGGAVLLKGGHLGPAQVFVCTVASLVLLPAGFIYQREAFPTNDPIWSLFFEFTANAAFWIERRVNLANARLPSMLILVTSGLALIVVACIWHGLEPVGFRTVPAFFAGFVRVTFPFFSGVFIYRFGLYKHGLPMPSLALAVALLALLALPLFSGAWAYDVIAVIFVFPALVISGTQATHSGLLSVAWKYLGKLSYPFYIVHQPILRIVASAAKFMHLSGIALAALPVLGILAAAVSAYVITIIYDEPIRRWLSAKHDSWARGGRSGPTSFPDHPLITP
jgi:peptidoglycan/LPS O-acetylase OafA/YrhL